MTEAELRRHIQAFIARAATGPSAVRGRGNAGVGAAAREFLGAMPLRPFGARGAKVFIKELDRRTELLRKSFPRGARHWGLARKLINVFLRDALFTVHLRNGYELDRATSLLELPLDRFTAERLLTQYTQSELPVWRGVRYVDALSNAAYQRAAAEIAASYRVARVHLDAVWYGTRGSVVDGSR